MFTRATSGGNKASGNIGQSISLPTDVMTGVHVAAYTAGISVGSYFGQAGLIAAGTEPAMVEALAAAGSPVESLKSSLPRPSGYRLPRPGNHVKSPASAAGQDAYRQSVIAAIEASGGNVDDLIDDDDDTES